LPSFTYLAAPPWQQPSPHFIERADISLGFREMRHIKNDGASLFPQRPPPVSDSASCLGTQPEFLWSAYNGAALSPFSRPLQAILPHIYRNAKHGSNGFSYAFT